MDVPPFIESIMYIEETVEYAIILLDAKEREASGANYGIINKRYDVIECRSSVLFIAYDMLKEMQEKHDKYKPKPVLKSVT